MLNKVLFATLISSVLSLPSNLENVDRGSSKYVFQKSDLLSYPSGSAATSPVLNNELQTYSNIITPFNFSIEVSDSLTGNEYSHKSKIHEDDKNGDYRVLLPDGRTQIVSYFIDKSGGYNADVRYEGEARAYVPPVKEDNAGEGHEGKPNTEQVNSKISKRENDITSAVSVKAYLTTSRNRKVLRQIDLPNQNILSLTKENRKELGLASVSPSPNSTVPEDAFSVMVAQVAENYNTPKQVFNRTIHIRQEPTAQQSLFTSELPSESQFHPEANIKSAVYSAAQQSVDASNLLFLDAAAENSIHNIQSNKILEQIPTSSEAQIKIHTSLPQTNLSSLQEDHTLQQLHIQPALQAELPEPITSNLLPTRQPADPQPSHLPPSIPADISKVLDPSPDSTILLSEVPKQSYLPPVLADEGAKILEQSSFSPTLPGDVPRQSKSLPSQPAEALKPEQFSLSPALPIEVPKQSNLSPSQPADAAKSKAKSSFNSHLLVEVPKQSNPSHSQKAEIPKPKQFSFPPTLPAKASKPFHLSPFQPVEAEVPKVKGQFSAQHSQPAPSQSFLQSIVPVGVSEKQEVTKESSIPNSAFLEQPFLKQIQDNKIPEKTNPSDVRITNGPLHIKNLLPQKNPISQQNRSTPEQVTLHETNKMPSQSYLLPAKAQTEKTDTAATSDPTNLVLIKNNTTIEVKAIQQEQNDWTPLVLTGNKENTHLLPARSSKELDKTYLPPSLFSNVIGTQVLSNSQLEAGRKVIRQAYSPSVPISTIQYSTPQLPLAPEPANLYSIPQLPTAPQPGNKYNVPQLPLAPKPSNQYSPPQLPIALDPTNPHSIPQLPPAPQPKNKYNEPQLPPAPKPTNEYNVPQLPLVPKPTSHYSPRQLTQAPANTNQYIIQQLPRAPQSTNKFSNPQLPPAPKPSNEYNIPQLPLAPKPISQYFPPQLPLSLEPANQYSIHHLPPVPQPTNKYRESQLPPAPKPTNEYNVQQLPLAPKPTSQYSIPQLPLSQEPANQYSIPHFAPVPQPKNPYRESQLPPVHKPTNENYVPQLSLAPKPTSQYSMPQLPLSLEPTNQYSTPHLPPVPQPKNTYRESQLPLIPKPTNENYVPQLQSAPKSTSQYSIPQIPLSPESTIQYSIPQLTQPQPTNQYSVPQSPKTPGEVDPYDKSGFGTLKTESIIEQPADDPQVYNLSLPIVPRTSYNTASSPYG